MENDKNISDEYKMAAREVIDILNLLPKEETEKIPKKLYEFFYNIASKDYISKIKLSDDIENNNLMEKTKDILAMLYWNYWCSDEEKIEFGKQLNENERKYQENLNKKYNPDDLFKKEKEIEETTVDEQLPVVIQKEKIFTRFLNFIKRILRIKK